MALDIQNLALALALVRLLVSVSKVEDIRYNKIYHELKTPRPLSQKKHTRKAKFT
jgi:hypothetical protein